MQDPPIVSGWFTAVCSECVRRRRCRQFFNWPTCEECINRVCAEDDPEKACGPRSPEPAYTLASNPGPDPNGWSNA